jgi:hypothetical protein
MFRVRRCSLFAASAAGACLIAVPALASGNSGQHATVKIQSVAKSRFRPGVLIAAPRVARNMKVLSWQWLRCDKQGSHCAAIPRASKRTYRIRTADEGHVLRVRLVLASSQGSTTALSAATPVIGLPLPVNTAAPSVTDTTSSTYILGDTLSVNPGSWNYAVRYTYQWQDCDTNGANCTNITSATGQTYVLQSTDVGHTLVVVVTAYNF